MYERINLLTLNELTVYAEISRMTDGRTVKSTSTSVYWGDQLLSKTAKMTNAMDYAFNGVLLWNPKFMSWMTAEIREKIIQTFRSADFIMGIKLNPGRVLTDGILFPYLDHPTRPFVTIQITNQLFHYENNRVDVTGQLRMQTEIVCDGRVISDTQMFGPLQTPKLPDLDRLLAVMYATMEPEATQGQ